MSHTLNGHRTTNSMSQCIIERDIASLRSRLAIQREMHDRPDMNGYRRQIEIIIEELSRELNGRLREQAVLADTL